MKTARITRRMAFCAGHRLHCGAWSDEENRRVFGKCNHPSGHGHNYVAEVTLEGPIDPGSGMVYNLSELKRAMTETIEEGLDHKNLNVDVPSFRDRIPTAENIAVVIWEGLEARLPPGMLKEVRLIETENNSVAYRG